jgi:serine/threonine-protein kinase
VAGRARTLIVPINLDRLKTGGAFQGALAQAALPPEPVLRELAPGDRVGPFRIERELSRGGMGIVYRAERADGEFAQRVALKWMSGSRDRDVAEALFRRERDILASLEHPGIARLIDGGRTSDEMLWFAMEFVQGEAIDRWCAARSLSIAARVRLVLELTAALAFAHQRLLIHRDIKPANVLVGEDGRVKLLDFGIARLADQRDLLGTAALTPGYASPEQWAHGEVTVASDVYQVGLLLAVLLEVARPEGEGTHVTRVVLPGPLQAEPIAFAAGALANLPRDLAAIITRATALVPEQRYVSAAALGDDLARYLDRRPVAARDGTALYRISCLLRRHPLVSGAALASAIALATLGARVVIERSIAREEAARATAEAARATAESTRAQASLRFLTDLLAWADPRNHGGEQVTVTAALARGATQLGATGLSEPRLRAELLHLIGELYLMREEVEQSTPLLREARAIIVATPDIDPMLRARNALDLAASLTTAEDAEAMALLDEVKRLPNIADGAAALRIQAARHRASLIYRRGDLVGASIEQREALDAVRADQPAETTESIMIRNNLAGYVGDLGDHETALGLKRENREAAVARFGEVHPLSSLAATTLARTLLSLGRFDEAESLLESDGQVRAKLWGTSHPQYGVYLQNRARLQGRRGRLNEARTTILQAIAISRAGGGGGRLQLSSQLGDLADIELARGDAVAAEQAARQSLDPALRRAAVVKDFGARVLSRLQALRTLGRYEEIRTALPLLRAELAPLPERHPRHAWAALEASWLATNDGNTLGARSEAERALALAEAAYPSLDQKDALAATRARLAALSSPD